MPVKTHKVPKKHPHHYAKVYWPYLPLVLVVGAALWLGHASVTRSQRGVLAYSTNVTATNLLHETNSQRQSAGDSTLVSNELLSKAAQAKADDMVKENYWSHSTPDGQAPWIFIDQTGYGYHKAGENLAYGFGNSTDVVKGWMNSPAHRENLLDSDYHEVGFGIANSQNFQGTGPETIIVAMYAQPGVSPSVSSFVSPKNQVRAFTTANMFATESSKTISRAQTITGGRAPWVTFAAGLLAGVGVAFLLVKNSVRIHRAWRKGEKFVIKHPVLDVTVVAFIALCALLTQNAGSIL